MISKLIRKSNNRGYILVTIIMLFSILSVMSLLVFSSISLSSKSTTNQHNYQQAFYTAKSACSATATYLLENINDEQVLEALTSNKGTGNIDKMGDYEVTVSYVADARIKVMAVANYKGQSATVSSYLISLPRPSGICPTDNAIYVNGTASFGQSQVYNGDVYINGDMTLQYGSQVNGNLVVQGNANITGGTFNAGSLYASGNITLGGSGTVGSIVSKGDLLMSGGSRVLGDVYIDGSLTMSNGNINGNATVQYNSHFSGGSNKIGGRLFYGGSVTTAWGNINDFAKYNTKISNYSLVNDAKYVSQALPTLTPPSRSSLPGLYNAVTITNKTISTSGTLTQTVVNSINNSSEWGGNYTIDCTKSDIHLRIDNVNFTLTRGQVFNVKTSGDYNCYIYLTGNSTFGLNGNNFFGLNVDPITNPPRIFIIGEGTQTVKLISSSTLNAVVYLPHGTVIAQGSTFNSTYKLIGCCISKYLTIDNDVKFYYTPPKTEDTPLDVFEPGSSANPAWKIESWGAN